nr:MAG TPA: hypothetical protein [Caudoviricetes sp.]
MKNVNVNKGIYKVKIYIKGNEGYGWDDLAEVFHLDYTSVVEVKNDMILTEDVLLELFKDELPKFGNYFIKKCEVDDVTELYNTYLTRKKEYNKDLAVTDFDKWEKLYNLIVDLAMDITDEYLDVDVDEIQIKTIGEQNVTK